MAKTPTLGSLIDQLDRIRNERREISERDKVLKQEYDAVELQVLEVLDAQGLDKATGNKATVSISRVIVATIDDFDALTKYIKRSGNFQLFQRRISDPSFREILATKGVVPGLSPFEKVNLNLRSL
jgi:uncharacterized protein (DUF1786 family)